MATGGIPPNNGDWRERMERVERTMERFVSIQADHEGKIADLTAVQDRTLGIIEKIVEVQQGTQRQIDQLAPNMEALAAAQARMAAAQQHMDERMGEMSDKLNALIHVVDGVIRREPPKQ